MDFTVISLLLLLTAPGLTFAGSDEHSNELSDYYDSGHHSDYKDGHYGTYSHHDYSALGSDYSSSDYGSSSKYSSSGQSNGVVRCIPGVQFIRHPFRCDQFYQCAHGQAEHVVTCPGDLLFNTLLSVCDWPSNVNCHNDLTSSRYSLDDSYTGGSSDHHDSEYYGDDHSSSYYHYDDGHDDSSSDEDHGDDDDHHDDESEDYWEGDDYHGDGTYGTYGHGHGGNTYNYILPHHPGLSSIQMYPPYMQPIQWHPHPAFGLSGAYQLPASGYGSSSSMASGSYRTPGSYSPMLSGLFDYQYQHPSHLGSQTYDRSYHDQTYQFGHGGYHHDEDYHGYDDSHDDDYHGYDDSHGYDYHGYDDHHGYDYDHHDSSDDSDDSDDDDHHYDSDSSSYGSSEEYNYGDGHYDPHLHNLLERYYDGGAYDHGRYMSDSEEVEEQSAWLYPYLRHPHSRRHLEPMYHRGHDVQYIHYVHDGGPYDHYGPARYYHHDDHDKDGEGDNSLLPLLLLKSPEAKKLLMTSTLLSKLKGVTGDELLGGSGGLKDFLTRQALLDLLTNSQNQPTGTGTGMMGQGQNPTQSQGQGQNRRLPANLRYDPVRRLYLSLATQQPMQLFNPRTNIAVNPDRSFVDPLSGSVIETSSGQPLGFLEPLTGTIVPAIVQPGQSAQSLQTSRLTQQSPALLQTRLGQGSVTSNLFQGQGQGSITPTLFQGQGASGTAGNDALNLIFLSPLTPSSLPPPPLLANTGSDALIRGSLREVLGPGLAEVVEQSSAPLVPGQRVPNAAAGGGGFCTVVRSGETVPFRLNPRGGRQLSRQECDAMGRVLDTFIPTYLRTFVTRDAALAGFNRAGPRAGSTNSQDPFISRRPGNSLVRNANVNSNVNVNTNIGDVGNGIFDNPRSSNDNDAFASLFNSNVNRNVNSNINSNSNFNGGGGSSGLGINVNGNTNINSNFGSENANFARANSNFVGLNSNRNSNINSNLNSNINNNNIFGSGAAATNNLSDFISVRQDITGCSILVPNIVPYC